MKKKTWLIALAIVILVVAGIGIYVARSGNSLDISYREVTAKKGDLNLTILSTGTVSPENRLEIKPPIAGRVEQVLAKEGQRVRKGEVLAWMSSTERAALLDAARSKGPDELKKWEELYRPTPILAPIPGTIILRNVEAGQTFTGTDAVFVMSDRLTVKAQVDETDISQVALKQSAMIVLDAYPDRKVAGRVDKIAFDATTVNNVTTYVVDVLPDETPPEMRSGMTANVTFYVAAHENVLLVPAEGVKVREKTHFVLVPSASGEPVEKPVEVGLSDGKRTEITQGLSEGDRIVIAEVRSQSKGGSGTATNPFSPMGRGRRGGGH